LNPQLVLALILLASVMLNVGLILWLVKSKVGPQRLLFAWVGNGWDPVRLKPGQTQHVYKRPDGVKVVFKLEEEWAKPLGKRGLLWLGNAMNSGDMYRWETEEEAWVHLVAPGDDESRADLSKWTPLKPGEEPPEKEGAFMSVEWQVRPMSPSGTYLATALDDIREQKWFEAHKAAEAGAKVKPNWLLIAGAAIAVWFFFIRGH